MGICGTKDLNKQVLLCGLEEAGKTTLLYTEYGMHIDEFTTEPTLGYNSESVDIKDRKVNIFDVGGQESVRYLWPIFYKKIKFDALLFMIDATDEQKFYEAKSEFHKLVNEEELRNVVFCVLYNYKAKSDSTYGRYSTKSLDDSNEEYESLKKTLDKQLGIEELHTFQVRKSFIFDILSKKDKARKEEMYEWLVEKLAHINE